MTTLPGFFAAGKRGVPSLFDDLETWLGDSAPRTHLKGFEIDVIDEEGGYIIEANIPGVNRDNIDITLENNMLTLTVKAEGKEEEKEKNYLHRERWEETRSRAVRLPKASATSGVKAGYEDGVLKIEVPKAPEAVSQKIEIS